MIAVCKLNETYSEQLAEILSTDMKLYYILSPNAKMERIIGAEYLQGCKTWETKRQGRCFAIVEGNRAIGSISYSYKEEQIASVGYWLRSDMWGKGFGTQAFGQMLSIVRKAGYTKLTASILKDNIASKEIWGKYNAIFDMDDERYYPLIILE